MDGNGSGGPRYAMETRAEKLQLVSAEKTVRRGESDRLEAGYGTSYDVVAGTEEVTVGGNLIEEVGEKAPSRNVHRGATFRAARAETVVRGKLSVAAAKGEMTMLGGAMSETHAGAVLLLAAMSDNLLAGYGVRATVQDMWLSRLVGMEEKISTAVADGMLTELSGMHFEREYGPGNHQVGTASFTGTLHSTTATGFWPLFKVLRNVRDLTAGGGGGTGETAPPPPPTAPVSAAGVSGAAVVAARAGVSAGRGASGLASGNDLLSLARHADNVADVARAEQLTDALAQVDDVVAASSDLDNFARTSDIATQMEDLRAANLADDPLLAKAAPDAEFDAYLAAFDPQKVPEGPQSASADLPDGFQETQAMLDVLKNPPPDEPGLDVTDIPKKLAFYDRGDKPLIVDHWLGGETTVRKVGKNLGDFSKGDFFDMVVGDVENAASALRQDLSYNGVPGAGDMSFQDLRVASWQTIQDLEAAEDFEEARQLRQSLADFDDVVNRTVGDLITLYPDRSLEDLRHSPDGFENTQAMLDLFKNDVPAPPTGQQAMLDLAMGRNASPNAIADRARWNALQSARAQVEDAADALTADLARHGVANAEELSFQDARLASWEKIQDLQAAGDLEGARQLRASLADFDRVANAAVAKAVTQVPDLANNDVLRSVAAVSGDWASAQLLASRTRVPEGWKMENAWADLLALSNTYRRNADFDALHVLNVARDDLQELATGLRPLVEDLGQHANDMDFDDILTMLDDVGRSDALASVGNASLEDVAEIRSRLTAALDDSLAKLAAEDADIAGIHDEWKRTVASGPQYEVRETDTVYRGWREAPIGGVGDGIEIDVWTRGGARLEDVRAQRLEDLRTIAANADEAKQRQISDVIALMSIINNFDAVAYQRFSEALLQAQDFVGRPKALLPGTVNQAELVEVLEGGQRAARQAMLAAADSEDIEGMTRFQMLVEAYETALRDVRLGFDPSQTFGEELRHQSRLASAEDLSGMDAWKYMYFQEAANTVQQVLKENGLASADFRRPLVGMSDLTRSARAGGSQLDLADQLSVAVQLDALADAGVQRGMEFVDVAGDVARVDTPAVRLEEFGALEDGTSAGRYVEEAIDPDAYRVARAQAADDTGVDELGALLDTIAAPAPAAVPDQSLAENEWKYATADEVLRGEILWYDANVDHSVARTIEFPLAPAGVSTSRGSMASNWQQFVNPTYGRDDLFDVVRRPTAAGGEADYVQVRNPIYDSTLAVEDGHYNRLDRQTQYLAGTPGYGRLGAVPDGEGASRLADAEDISEIDAAPYPFLTRSPNDGIYVSLDEIRSGRVFETPAPDFMDPPGTSHYEEIPGVRARVEPMDSPFDDPIYTMTTPSAPDADAAAPSTPAAAIYAEEPIYADLEEIRTAVLGSVEPAPRPPSAQAADEDGYASFADVRAGTGAGGGTSGDGGSGAIEGLFGDFWNSDGGDFFAMVESDGASALGDARHGDAVSESSGGDDVSVLSYQSSDGDDVSVMSYQSSVAGDAEDDGWWRGVWRKGEDTGSEWYPDFLSLSGTTFRVSVTGRSRGADGKYIIELQDRVVDALKAGTHSLIVWDFRNMEQLDATRYTVVAFSDVVGKPDYMLRADDAASAYSTVDEAHALSRRHDEWFQRVRLSPVDGDEVLEGHGRGPSRWTRAKNWLSEKLGLSATVDTGWTFVEGGDWEEVQRMWQQVQRDAFDDNLKSLNLL